jgi:ABC-type polysaccharide/polyol phosphate export permease
MMHADPANTPPAIALAALPEPNAAPSAVSPAGALRSLREIVAELWQYRDLLHQIVLRDVRLRYKQAVMGLAWAVLMPLLIVSAGLILRFAMSRSASFGGPDVATVAVRALAWSFVVGALGFATGSVSANASLVTKVYFPREVLPIAAVLTQVIDFVVGGVVLAVLLPFLGARGSAALLWVPLLVAMLVAIVLAAALVTSCANLFFRDVKYLVQVGLTFGIFFTPVLLDPAQLGDRLAAVMMLNPVAPMLEGLRLAIVEGHNLLQPLALTVPGGEVVTVWQPWYLGYGAVWSIGSLIAAALLFHRFEFVFAEYA